VGVAVCVGVAVGVAVRVEVGEGVAVSVGVVVVVDVGVAVGGMSLATNGRYPRTGNAFRPIGAPAFAVKMAAPNAPSSSAPKAQNSRRCFTACPPRVDRITP
jgi:hypothetical protein